MSFIYNYFSYFLILNFLFVFTSANAQETNVLKNWGNEYQSLLNTQKLIVHFSEDVPLTTQQQLLQAERSLQQPTQHIYLPQPKNTVIVRLQKTTFANYQQTIARLQQYPEIEAVEPYLRLENEVEVGILPKVFVRLKNSADITLLEKILTPLNDFAIQKHPYLKQVYSIATNKNTSLSTLDLATSLHQSGLFDYAEPNYLLNPLVSNTNDPLLERQWAIENTGSALQGNGTPDADMSVFDAWWYTTGSPNIKVAVIDSGTDTNHIDLKNNLLAGYDAIGNETDGFPYLTYPEESHGTACAGIIAAEGNNEVGTAGIAYDCSIVPVKVFYYVDTLNFADLIPFSTSEWMTNAISWAWQEGNADVLSNSWGLPPLLLALLPGEPAVVEQAIEEAALNGRSGKGTAMLFSSGNDGNTPIWPSYLPTTIAVNASSPCDERKSPTSCDGRDWEGNWGEDLDITAPGVNIASCDIMGAFGYTATDFTNTFGGTSAACPNAAGVVALMLSVNPELSSEQLKALLCASADKAGGYAYDSTGIYGNWSKEMGYGRVNALEAVIQAQLTTGEQNGNYSSNNLHIYPIPTKDKLVVDIASNRLASVTLKIFNVIGLQVFEQTIALKQEQQSIPILLTPLNLISGTYFLQVKIDNEFVSKKIIKY